MNPPQILPLEPEKGPAVKIYTTRLGKLSFLAGKLSADLGRLLYSTYLGGTDADAGRAAAVDVRGNFLVGGEVNSRDWPTRNAPRATPRGRGDGGLAKFTLGPR